MATINLNHETRLNVLPEFELTDQRKWAVQMGLNAMLVLFVTKFMYQHQQQAAHQPNYPMVSGMEIQAFLANNASEFWATRRHERQGQFTKLIVETCALKATAYQHQLISANLGETTRTSLSGLPKDHPAPKQV
ncbi:hypothetical protein BGZ83_001789 [Gryganskiella cystojenkinii]|nr:hypothetical protein BGZ83_001789 [Gryganskiella cystojenkinii]